MVFYAANQETVPVSGRRRFNCYSPQSEAEQGKEMYNMVLQEYQGKILSPRDRRSIQVKRVLERLIPVSGMEGEGWEVVVIDDDCRLRYAMSRPGC